MKRLMLLLILCLPMALMAQKKVAVYVTTDDPKVDEAQKEIIGGELVAAIVQTKQYKAVERTADFLQQISKEQGYQHSGNVDDDQISALGKQFGVDYVCVAYIIPYKNTYYIQARLIDVETATVQAIARETSALSGPDDLMATAGKVAQALINPDGTYKAPVANNSSKDKDKYKSAKKATTTTTEKPEGKVVRNTYDERHILGMKEFSYGSTQMDRKAYADFLWKNCPNAFIQYYHAQRTVTAGWVLFGLGAAMSVVGWSVCGCSSELAKKKYPNGYVLYHFGGPISFKEERDQFEDLKHTYEVCGAVIGSIGVAAVGTSIVLLPIGYANRDKKAIETYNSQCAYKRTAACTLNLQSSRDGIGIALTF